jgi:hypothetical protein
MTARQPKRGSCSAPESGVPAIVRDVVRTPGTPLAARESSRFGHDFSSVRVHADGDAATSARAVHARAFTLGEHVVFGANEFAPHTQRGQELLAHELGHVAEQRAGAPVEIARMPDDADAGPRLDDSKVLIDAVPDILQSSLAGGSTTVNVKVSDANVKSIKWTLTAPDDSIVDSVKTNPANPAAKTRPFSITSKHVSGATGRYHLRCDGIDASGKERVYGIRDFNVMASDLATGTGSQGSFGTLTFTNYTPMPAAGGQKAYLHATLKFLPNKSVKCDKILFVQAVQTIGPQGKHTHVGTSLDDRASAAAWSIDKQEGERSPFYNAGSVPGVPTANVGKGGPTPVETELDDSPEGKWGVPSVVRFESCAICNQANPKQVYGCATWGYTWDGNSGSKPVPMPRSFSDSPSDEFRGAAKGWNEWLKRTATKATP